MQEPPKVIEPYRDRLVSHRRYGTYPRITYQNTALTENETKPEPMSGPHAFNAMTRQLQPAVMPRKGSVDSLDQ